MRRGLILSPKKHPLIKQNLILMFGYIHSSWCIQILEVRDGYGTRTINVGLKGYTIMLRSPLAPPRPILPNFARVNFSTQTPVQTYALAPTAVSHNMHMH